MSESGSFCRAKPSLYGLDFLVDNERKYHLLELNGVTCGMRGFREVYGDRRVEEKVRDMIVEAVHGDIEVNDGSFAQQRWEKKHKIGLLLGSLLKKYFPKRFARSVSRAREKRIFLYGRSPRYLVDWIFEPTEMHAEENINDKKQGENGLGKISRAIPWFPFPVYQRDPSTLKTIINLTGELMINPQVNYFTAEAITRNKFLQYLVLRDTEVGEYLPPTRLVGLGAARPQDIEEVIATSATGKLVRKPLLGLQGKGVRIYSPEEGRNDPALSQGPIVPATFFHLFLAGMDITPPLLYLEDLIMRRKFNFEHALAVLQPFIDSRREEDGESTPYRSLRAIVCNGRFIDVYERRSFSSVVNLARGATAHAYEDHTLPELCERIITVYERECTRLTPRHLDADPFQFNSELYGKWLKERGLTSKEQRKKDAFRDSLFDFILVPFIEAQGVTENQR